MWNSIAQSGFASAGVDSTDSLSLLVAGLVSLVWLAAGLITILAMHTTGLHPNPRLGGLRPPRPLWTTRRRRNEVALPRRT